MDGGFRQDGVANPAPSIRSVLAAPARLRIRAATPEDTEPLRRKMLRTRQTSGAGVNQLLTIDGIEEALHRANITPSPMGGSVSPGRPRHPKPFGGKRSRLLGTERSVGFAAQLRAAGFIRFEEAIDDFRERFNDAWLQR
jgi:hypothetical protein